MKHPDSATRQPPLNLAVALVLLAVLLFFMLWPMVFLPFGMLPYLQRHSFVERFLFGCAVFLLVGAMLWLSNTRSRREHLLRTRLRSFDEKLKIFATVPVCAFICAWLSTNSLGSLAYVTQGRPFDRVYSVVDTDRPKNSLQLEVASVEDNSLHAIELSGRLRPKVAVKVGSRIRLIGKETPFGVYITRYELDPPTGA